MVRPTPNGKIDGCFFNVIDVVLDNGGRSLFGWSIWEGAVTLEAIFHVIWESPEGELVDVTPQADGETTTLFLHHQEMGNSSESEQAKRYFAKIDHPAVRELMELLLWEEKVVDSYRVQATGQVLMPRSQRRELERRFQHVEKKIERVLERMPKRK